MAKVRERLKRAPITEAVIDVKVSLRNEFTAEMLRDVRTNLEPLFPHVEEQRQVEAIMQMIEGRFSHSANDQGVRRLVLRSTDRNEVVLASDGGFAFSKLRPYTSWNEVFSSAKRFWETYVSVVPVESVQRIAVRYINQFHVPRTKELADYLTAPPALPETIMFDEMGSSLIRLSIRDQASKVESTLVQVTEPVESGTSVMIDIDCFRTGEFDPRAPEYWSLFEELRTTKNRIFFGSIHESTAEAFDQ